MKKQKGMGENYNEWQNIYIVTFKKNEKTVMLIESF